MRFSVQREQDGRASNGSAAPLFANDADDGPDGGRLRCSSTCNDQHVPRHLRLFEWTLLLVAAIAGFADAPRWFILLAAAGLTIDDWAKLWPLRSPAVTLSTKVVTYFVTGIAANVFYSAASYLIGAGGRALLW